MQRQFVIGDIHGCSRALRRLCEAVELHPGDTLITLGDYVNKGPDSRGVIIWLLALDRALTLVPLRGNHDRLMQNARRDPLSYRQWLGSGGAATLASYRPANAARGTLADVPQAHWAFLDRRLLPYFETATHFFVHAGALPHLPLPKQPDTALYEQRFIAPGRAHCSGKIMVCGHTAQQNGLPLATEHAVCLDTRCFARGWLSCLEPASERVWQANERGETRCVPLVCGAA